MEAEMARTPKTLPVVWGHEPNERYHRATQTTWTEEGPGRLSCKLDNWQLRVETREGWSSWRWQAIHLVTGARGGHGDCQHEHEAMQAAVDVAKPPDAQALRRRRNRAKEKERKAAYDNELDALRNEVVHHARKWWENKRPISRDEDEHLRVATVNCAGSKDSNLAKAVAALIKAEKARAKGHR